MYLVTYIPTKIEYQHCLPTSDLKVFSVVHLHFSSGQFYIFGCPCLNVQIWAEMFWAHFPKNVGNGPCFHFLHICVRFKKVKVIKIQMPETKEIPIKKNSFSKFTFTGCFYWPQDVDKYDTKKIFSFSKYVRVILRCWGKLSLVEGRFSKWF